MMHLIAPSPCQSTVHSLVAQAIFLKLRPRLSMSACVPPIGCGQGEKDCPTSPNGDFRIFV
jgi:hypothetical protein